MGGIYDSRISKIRVYPDRAPGGDCHHWSADLIAVAGGAKGPGSRQSHFMHQQHETDGLGSAQLPRHERSLPAVPRQRPASLAGKAEPGMDSVLELDGLHPALRRARQLME